MLRIENSLAMDVREEMEIDIGKWTGSQVQNRIADDRVAARIKQSFKTYEGGRKYQGSFFKFKRY